MKLSAAKPVEQKRRLGNPGQRKLPNLAEVTPLPQADVEPLVPLGAAGRRMWDQVKATCGTWVALSDTTALLELCQLVDEREEMREQVKSEGRVLRLNNSGAQAHPLVDRIQTTTKQIHSLLSAFGMTPADRGKLGVGEVKPQSKIDKLKAIEGQN